MNVVVWAAKDWWYYTEPENRIQEYRGAGYGKCLLQKLAEIAVERGCGRLEWWCLDWNQTSIGFYLSLGAKPMNDWTVYRINGDTLLNMAEQRNGENWKSSLKD